MTHRNISIHTICPSCGESDIVTVFAADYKAWAYAGARAQDAFPYLSVGKREQLISGTCDACWDKMHAGDDD